MHEQFVAEDRVEDRLRGEAAFNPSRCAIRLHDEGHTGAAQQRGASRRQQITAGMQVRDVELACMRAQPAGEPYRRVELPAIRRRVREIREDEDLDAVGGACGSGC